MSAYLSRAVGTVPPGRWRGADPMAPAIARIVMRPSNEYAIDHGTCVTPLSIGHRGAEQFRPLIRLNAAGRLPARVSGRRPPCALLTPSRQGSAPWQHP